LQADGYLRYENLPLQTRTGILREVEFVSNVYEEGSQRVIQCNIRDITDRKRAEEERRLLLESAQAARAEADAANGIKDEFLATLSHELRTPLTSILGWSHLLTNGKLDARESKRAIETIARNAYAQKQLVDELLDISRIITGKLRLDVRPVELGPIIEAVIDSVRPAADARNIQLQTTIEPCLNPIAADAGRLQQVIWNLLSNAIKFTPEGGRVQARLGRCDSHLEITISDSGLGIAPDLLLHVFDRFRQFDSSTTRTHGGLGLGLAIVRQLVELHGGTVTAESPGEGKGSTFKVILPERSVPREPGNSGQQHQPVITGKVPTNQEASLKGLKVLVVDDERDTRELISAVLLVGGAKVISVTSAFEALRELSRKRFDVLLCDIGMPEMDGYALIRKIRQRSARLGGGIPAAAITAYAGIEDHDRVLAAGYQVHIPKPIVPAELVTAVASLAGHNRPLPIRSESRRTASGFSSRKAFI
jgi:signal transduction histidine kinase/CheY-like chemotaxis protein